jgi:hypothetical protein
MNDIKEQLIELMQSKCTGYMVNISVKDELFYVWPTLLNKSDLIMTPTKYCDVGLYFLFNKGVVVYIGASKKNIQRRIISHTEDKIFDSYFILTAKDDYNVINNDTLDRLINKEAYLICSFKPKYNSLSQIALKPINNDHPHKYT